MFKSIKRIYKSRILLLAIVLLFLSRQFFSARLKDEKIDVESVSFRSAATDSLNSRTDKDEATQRELVYAAYHEGRKEKCDGCRYVPFYLRMYPKVKSVFDAGAANCGVMRLLEAKGFEVEGLEYSEWVVKKYCKDFLSYPQRVYIGAIHLASIPIKAFDLVLCTDVLEHVPIEDIPATLSRITNLAKPGGNVFLVIASDPSKHENHPERSSAAQELQKSGLKIHETVKPRSWWLMQLEEHGLIEDKGLMEKFLQINRDEVHDPRYGYIINNFKNRGYMKVYEPNKRHVDRVYCLKKTFS
ncbi:unnamed protein product [Bathycoccus prasinos]